MSGTINIEPSAFASHSILFFRTDTNKAFLEIKTDGTVIWKGREVESDADFRAAMMEVHKHMCGSVNGELATARAPLAEVERLTAERDALAAEVAALKALNASIAGDVIGLRIACEVLKAEVVLDFADDLARVTAERDEAQRVICEWEASFSDGKDSRQIAVERGWDCFDAKEGNT